MQTTENATARRLMESFMRFRRLHWKRAPVEGLTRGEAMVLFAIKKAPNPDEQGIKVSEIGNLLRVASPTITQQVNELEAHGFVERTMDKEDRRAVRVTLTEKGECAVQKAMASFMASFSGLAEYLGEEDSDRLAELMSKVFVYFDEVREPDI